MIEYKNETEDDLREMKRQITHELERRSKEKTKDVYVIRCAGNETFHKEFKGAKDEFIEEVDFATKDCSNKMSIEKRSIPETEYDLRPDTWFSA